MIDEVNNEEREAIEHITREMVGEENKPAEFLSAWKSAVQMIGESFFSVTSATVLIADSKWDLRPDMLLVEKALPALSSGERYFLIGVCQFYCDSDIKCVCERLKIEPPSLADYSNLDANRRSVLVSLMNSYTGW